MKLLYNDLVFHCILVVSTYLVKFNLNDSLILNSSKFFFAIIPAASKNTTCYKSGQNWPENIHFDYQGSV